MSCRHRTLRDLRELPDVLDGPGGDDLLAVGAPLVAAAPREDPGPLRVTRDTIFSL